MVNLRDSLKNGDFKRVYLFYGDEDYLKDYNCSLVRRAVLAPEDTININEYDSDNLDVPALIEQAGTMPYFAQRRLIVARRTGLFKNRSGDALSEALPHVPEQTVIVFVEDEVDRKYKLFKAVQKVGWVQECSHLREDALRRWMVGYLARRDCRITGSALDLLMQCVEDDMYSIANELDKLAACAYGSEGIRREDVEAACTLRPENRIFDLVDAIAAGKSGRAVKLYRDLISFREAPLRILSLISRQYNLILQVKELRDQGFDRHAIAEKTGLRDFVVSKCLSQAERYSLKGAEAALTLCVDTEEKVKTGFLEDDTAVEILIVSLTKQEA